jgi:hypothetical protein
MRLPMIFPLLLALLTLVSAKDWCFTGKCPTRNPDNTIPPKRSSYNVFVDARVNLPPNWRDNWRWNEANGPMFEDGPDVVHNDDGEEVRVRSSYNFFVEAKDKLPKLPDCFGKCPEEWYDGKEHPPAKRDDDSDDDSDDDEDPIFNDGPDVVHNDNMRAKRSSYNFFVAAKDKLPKLPDCFGKCPEEWYDGKEHPPVKRAECPVDCTRMHEMCVVEGTPGDQCLEMECGWFGDMVSHDFVRDEGEANQWVV